MREYLGTRMSHRDTSAKLCRRQIAAEFQPNSAREAPAKFVHVSCGDRVSMHLASELRNINKAVWDKDMIVILIVRRVPIRHRKREL